MKNTSRGLRLGPYAVVLVAVFVAGAVLSVLAGRSYPGTGSHIAPPGRTACTSALDPIDAVLDGLPSNTCHRNPGEVTKAIRAVVVDPRGVTLLSGGRVVKSVATRTP